MKLGLGLLAVAGQAASGAPGGGAQDPQGPGCSRAAVASAAGALLSARAELAADRPEEDETLVPARTRRLIEQVKDRMRDYVRAGMACAPASPEPSAMVSALRAGAGYFDLDRDPAGPDDDPAGPDEAPPGPHGDRMLYEFSAVPGHKRMLAVVATLGIRCGTDSMLLLYRHSGAGWEEAMVRRSEPYGKISGGWADLRFAVSPPGEDGSWFVATLSTTPWCTSAWQGMPYELARPGLSPDRPRIFFQGKNSLYLGNESDLQLTAERDAAEIRHDGGSLDSDILIRRHVRRYSVAGESVLRVQPVAENVRDFVDEWIVSSWPESKGWSGKDPTLAAAHSRLQAARRKKLGGFASIRACRGGPTQVELAAPEEEERGWFFLVRGESAGPWTMERVIRRATADCAGPDTLKR